MNCPTPAELDAACTAGLDEPTRIHLESCERCRQAALEIGRETRLLDDLRAALQCGVRSTGSSDVPSGYTLIGELGRGGQGVVWEAVQHSTGRRVALKTLARGCAATSIQRSRFTREIRLAAGLRHPGLVTVFDAGETPDGTPFLAMELVRGVRWDEWSDSLRAMESEAAGPILLSTFLDLCYAVGHAHARSVLHRDLKPSNVLVEGGGRLRVLDLGLAKSIEDSAGPQEGPTFNTTSGEMLGSLAWMSPEQLSGRCAAHFESDVYSLGLLLHRACTGRHAYPLGRSVTEVVRGTAALPGSLRRPFVSDKRMDRGVHAILARSLAATPTQRYPSANEMAADVARLLEGQSIRRPFADRVPWAWLAAMTGVVLLFAALRPRWVEGRVVEVQNQFLAAVDQAESNGLAAFESFASATESARALGDAVAPAWRLPAPSDQQLGNWRLAASMVHALHPEFARVDLDAGINWRGLGHGSSGTRLLAFGDQGSLALVDLGADPPIVSYPPGLPCEVTTPQLSRDGRWAILYPKSSRGTWNAWLAEVSPDGVRSTREYGEDWSLSFAEAHPWLLELDSVSGAVVIRDLETDAEVRTWSEEGQPPLGMTFLAEDRLLQVSFASNQTSLRTYPDLEPSPIPIEGLASTSMTLENGLLATWGPVLSVLDTKTGSSAELLRFTQVPLVARAADGSLLAGQNSQLRRFRRRRDVRPRDAIEFRALPDWVLPSMAVALEASSDGRKVATLVDSGSIVIFEVDGDMFPQPIRTEQPHGTWFDVTPAPDGTGWLACGDGALARVGNERVEARDVCSGTELVLSLVPSGQGRVYFSTSRGRIGFLDSSSSDLPRWIHEFEQEVGALDLSPDGTQLCAADQGGTCRVLETDDDSVLWEFRDPDASRLTELAWAPSGEVIALASRAGRVLWARPGTAELTWSTARLGSARCLAFHPTQELLVSGHDGGVLEIWDVAALEPRESLRMRATQVDSPWALCFSDDGRFLAVGSGNEVSVWDWSARKRLFASRAHDGLVFSLAFLPGTPLLVSGAEAGELFLWDFRHGDRLLPGRIGR